MNYLVEHNFIKTFFVVGRASGPKADAIQRKIEQEHAMYGDILQVDFVEHRNNNTLKTLFAYKYLLSLNWNGHFPENVMKTDDDIYINIPLFVQNLYTEEKFAKIKTNSLVGFIHKKSYVFRIKKEDMKKTYTEYLFCPDYMYDQKLYPPFPSGIGYVIPWDMMPCLFQEALNLPYYFLEDVLIGGFVAKRCKLPRVEMPGFSAFGKDPAKADFKSDILIHYVNHAKKYQIHQLITAGHDTGLDNV